MDAVLQDRLLCQVHVVLNLVLMLPVLKFAVTQMQTKMDAVQPADHLLREPVVLNQVLP
jgi:hypothetical protein